MIFTIWTKGLESVYADWISEDKPESIKASEWVSHNNHRYNLIIPVIFHSYLSWIFSNSTMCYTNTKLGKRDVGLTNAFWACTSHPKCDAHMLIDTLRLYPCWSWHEYLPCNFVATWFLLSERKLRGRYSKVLVQFNK